MNLRKLALLSLILMPSAASARDDYSVVIAGAVKGKMSVDTPAPERVLVHLTLSDRGRDLDLRSDLRLAADGTPASMTTSGKDYIAGFASEHFVREGHIGKWTSRADRGSAPCAPGCFYYPHEMNPQALVLLARALHSDPDGRLKLLPSGEASIEHVSTLRIETGTAAVAAELYFIHGLGYGPEKLWLDSSEKLVFQGNAWVSVVRPGLEKHVDALVRAQDDVQSNRDIRKAAALQLRPAGPVLFRNVTLYDAQARVMRERMDVVVAGNIIERVQPSGAAAPKNAHIIEGAGRVLLPGLFDMHVHTAWDHDGPLAIASGVTSVRDLANDRDTLLRRKAQYDRNTLIGPRIVPAAMIDGRGPETGPTKNLVDSEEEAVRVIQSLYDAGYRHVKVYASIQPRLVPAIVKAAHERGMWVSGHIPVGMTLEQAVAAGFDEVQHASYWLQNFIPPSALDRRDGTALPDVPEWMLEPDSDKLAPLIALLKQHGTVLDPTLSIYENRLLGEAGEPTASLAAIADRLPPLIRRQAQFTTHYAPEERQINQRALRAVHTMFKRFHDAGVRMVVGTDFFVGIALPYELEVMVRAGLAPLDVLHMATLGAARVAKVDDRLGSITVGKLADLVLVEGNPACNIADVRLTRIVMKDGILHEADDLFALVGVKPLTVPAAVRTRPASHKKTFSECR